MVDESSFSAGPEVQDAVDITDSVHRRMIPESMYDRLKSDLPLNEEDERVVFRRLFPSMREEALFWFLALGERGIVLCSPGGIHYVPRNRVLNALTPADPDAEVRAMAAVDRYDPLSEAVVIVRNEGFSKVLIAGGASFPQNLWC